jgi:hypothetical protein
MPPHAILVHGDTESGTIDNLGVAVIDTDRL